MFYYDVVHHVFNFKILIAVSMNSVNKFNNIPMVGSRFIIVNQRFLFKVVNMV